MMLVDPGKPAESGQEIIERRIRILKSVGFMGGSEVLDIGCGNGETCRKLTRWFNHCWGIDKYYKPRGIKRCRFWVVDVEVDKTEFHFDRIISFEVIEHLQSQDLSYFYESLKPGGLLAITVPNKWWIFETHGSWISRGWTRVPFFSWLPKRIHDKFALAYNYTPRQIKRLLRIHGFKIKTWCYITAPLDVLKEGKFKFFLQTFVFNTDTTKIPFKSTSIFVLATK